MDKGHRHFLGRSGDKYKFGAPLGDIIEVEASSYSEAYAKLPDIRNDTRYNPPPEWSYT